MICGWTIKSKYLPLPSPPLPNNLIPPPRISTLSTELSTPLTPPTDHELKRLRMTKTEALSSGHRFARLKLPLAFPRMRVMGNRGGRR